MKLFKVFLRGRFAEATFFSVEEEPLKNGILVSEFIFAIASDFDHEPVNQFVHEFFTSMLYLLPGEVIVYILHQWLSAAETLTLSRLNRKFYQICNQNFVWKGVSLFLCHFYYLIFVNEHGTLLQLRNLLIGRNILLSEQPLRNQVIPKLL